MEKIIHFSVPEHISPIQAEAIKRARTLHPTWQIMVWRDPMQPDGYLLEKYWPKVNSGAQLSDLIRLDTVYRFGGVYIDSDVLLLKPLDQLVDLPFFIASEDGNSLTNAVFGARKRSPALRSLIDELLNQEPDWSRSPVYTTGPSLFTNKLLGRDDVTVLPRESFYPYGWKPGEERKTHRHSYGEHLWMASWKHELVAHSPQRSEEDSQSTTPSSTRYIMSNAYHEAHSRARWTARNVCNAVRNRFERCMQFGAGRFFDLSECALLANLVNGGDWVVHVGSNVRPFSRFIIPKIGRFGRLFALETRDNTLGGAGLDKIPVTDAIAIQWRNYSDVAGLHLDKRFPIDLPIKMLRIDAKADASLVLAGGARLVQRQCIDWILIAIPKLILSSQYKKTVEQLEIAVRHGYKLLTLAADGTLVECSDPGGAITTARGHVILQARQRKANLPKEVCESHNPKQCKK